MSNEIPEPAVQLESNPQQDFFLAAMHQYAVRHDGIIFKDGRMAICPVTPRVPRESNFGKIEASGFACTLACPKCNVIAKSDNFEMKNHIEILQISCMGTFNEFPFSKIEKPSIINE